MRPHLVPIFQMNLPEGEQLRNRLAKVANVDRMLLLALPGSISLIGRDRQREGVSSALGLGECLLKSKAGSGRAEVGC